jgi:hypothetical protein
MKINIVTPKILLAGMALVFLASCASVPMASLDADEKAKQFRPSSPKANLYVYRNEFFGNGIPMTVSINDKVLGQTAANTYFFLQLNPGPYSLQSHTENVSELKLSIESGRDYFVWQEVKMGVVSARSQLQEVDEKTGRNGVLESKLISQNFNAVEPLGAPIDTTTQGMPKVITAKSIGDKLKDLQALLKEGLITQDEFQQVKREILKGN